MEIQKQIVETLALEYGFDVQEALSKLNAQAEQRQEQAEEEQAEQLKPKQPKQPKPEIKKMSTILPFCGIVEENWCQGVRTNHNLYTQCTMPKHGDGKYCKTCQKQANENEGVPKHGDVSSLPNPKAVCYAKVMKKLDISRENAIQAAEEERRREEEERLAKERRKKREAAERVMTAGLFRRAFH